MPCAYVYVSVTVPFAYKISIELTLTLALALSSDLMLSLLIRIFIACALPNTLLIKLSPLLSPSICGAESGRKHFYCSEL